MIEYDLSIGNEELNTLCRLILCDRAVRHRQRPLVIFCTIFGVAALLLGLLYVSHGSVSSGCFMLAAAVGFFFLGLQGIYLIQVRAVKRNLKKEHADLLSVQRHYTLSEKGVRLTSQYGTTQNPWSAFLRWGVIGSYIYLQRADGGNLLFDRRKLNPQQLAELTELLAHLPRQDRA